MASIFDKAKVAYKNCISDLTKMGKALEQARAKDGKTFDVRILLNQFDILLQYSLLQVALADGHIAGEELSFIMDLSQYYPLPEYLKSFGYKNATWQVIYNTDETKLNEIVKKIEPSTIKLSQDFVNIFSLFGAATRRKYYNDMEDNIAWIIAATCQADGNPKDCEINKVCLIIDIFTKIKRNGL